MIYNTQDSCSGSPKVCSNTVISSCMNGDNYCPSGCDYISDTDCEQVVVNECSIDLDCNDGDDGTQDICSGTPKSCSNVLITTCAAGDNICPDNCNYTTDTDCADLNKCEVDDDCRDSNYRTIETCSGAPRECIISYESNVCVDGDTNCLNGCTFENDADCAAFNECETDIECDDNFEYTTDSCSGVPAKCSNEIMSCSEANGVFCYVSNCEGDYETQYFWLPMDRGDEEYSCCFGVCNE